MSWNSWDEVKISDIDFLKTMLSYCQNIILPSSFKRKERMLVNFLGAVELFEVFVNNTNLTFLSFLYKIRIEVS